MWDKLLKWFGLRDDPNYSYDDPEEWAIVIIGNETAFSFEQAVTIRQDMWSYLDPDLRPHVQIEVRREH